MLALTQELGLIYTQDDFKKWAIGTRYIIPIFTLPLVIVTAIASFLPLGFYRLPLRFVGYWSLFGACYTNIFASYISEFYLVTVVMIEMGYTSVAQLYEEHYLLRNLLITKTYFNVLNVIGSLIFIRGWLQHVAFFRNILLATDE